MKDFPIWFEQFEEKLTGAIEMISASASAMADDPFHPRTAIAHLNVAVKLLREAGVSIEKLIK